MRDIRSSEKQSEQKKSKETAEAQDSSVNLVTAAVRWEAAGDQEIWILIPFLQDPEAVARLHHQKVRAQEERRGADLYRNGNKLTRVPRVPRVRRAPAADAAPGLLHRLPAQTGPDLQLQAGAAGQYHCHCTVLCMCTVLYCIVLQVEYHAEYERALTEVKDELMAKEGPDLVETMKDEIREWFNKEK